MEFGAAAAAGITARLLCHPLDTVKTVAFTGFAQAQPTSRRKTNSTLCSSLRATARKIWISEGLSGFYRGLGIALTGAAPGVGLYLSTYYFTSQWMRSIYGVLFPSTDCFPDSAPTKAAERPAVSESNVHPLIYFLSGFVAEAVSCLVWVPVDVTKERLQSQPTQLVGRYTGSRDGMRRIYRLEGLRGFYKGYWSTLGSFGPFSGIYFIFYEYFMALIHRHSQGGDLETCAPLMAGLGGTVMASLCTNPLELIKTRLQVQHMCLGVGTSSEPARAPAERLFSYRYSGLRNGLFEVAKREGIFALWKGVFSRIAFQAPNAACTMMAYEYFTERLRQSVKEQKY